MTQATSFHAAPLRIGPTHPALPGHFPGRPVVPGVVLLDHVQQAAERWLGATVSLRTLPQVKFIAPLLPEQDAEIQLKLAGNELRFTILRANSTIAQGTMTIVLAERESVR